MAMTEIEQDALTILELAVEAQNRSEQLGVDQVAGSLTGPAIQERVDLSPMRINNAVRFLETNGYLEILRTFGTAPFEFREIEATPLGRLEYQRSRLPPPGGGMELAAVGLKRSPVPVGSP